MTIIVAPTLTGHSGPGIVWLPNQWEWMMRGEVADLTQEDVEYWVPSDTASCENRQTPHQGE